MAVGQARGNGQNGGHYYSNITQPVEISCNFVVDSANGNGLGVRSIKSNGYVQNVFMHTSAPLAGSGNPNPAAGYAMIQLVNNYNKYLGGFSGFVQATQTPTKIDNSALTIGQPYIITVLGNATAAQWLTLGVPAGVTPAVGVPFVAIATTAGTANTSTSRVSLPKSSNVFKNEVIGDSNLTVNTQRQTYGGQYILVEFFDITGAAVAPTDGSVCGMTFIFDASSVTIDGL